MLRLPMKRLRECVLCRLVEDKWLDLQLSVIIHFSVFLGSGLLLKFYLAWKEDVRVSLT